MAEEKEIIGYDCLGEPVYKPEPVNWTKEEELKALLEILDIVDVVNGVEYYDFGKWQYFATDKNGNPDLRNILTLDEQGNILKSEPFADEETLKNIGIHY